MLATPGTSFVSAFCALILLPLAAAAVWSPAGAPVCEATGEQHEPRIVSDGVGGMVVAWGDDRAGSGFALYAQRLDGSGHPHWATGGIPIGDDYGPQMQLGAMVPDGGNGAIMVWHTNDDSELFVHRVRWDGTQPWGVPGTWVDTDGDAITEVVALPDGAGGILMAWQVEIGGGDCQVRVQRVDADGNEVWAPGGLQVFTDSGSPNPYPRIVADGSGGIFIVARINNQIVCQRVYGSGASWPLITTVAQHPDEFHEWRNPALAGDGDGGIYVAFEYGMPNTGQVFVQRVGGDGVAAWPSFVEPCTAAGNETDPEIVNDGAGNAVVCWLDDRDAENIYAQKISPTGAVMWAETGAPVSFADWDVSAPRLLDGAGTNLLVVFHDDFGARVQMVDVTGGTPWGPDGVQIVPGLGADGFDVASDRMGGVLASIVDRRLEATHDIYAGAVNHAGGAYVAPFIVAVEDVPDDQGGSVRITVGSSDRDYYAVYEQPVARYDIWREIPPSAAAEPGAASLIDGRTGLPVDEAAKAVIPGGFWERIGSFAATQESEYVYQAPTLADSSAAGIHWTTYFVSAHTTDPLVWFSSEPASGYSVDNIAPGVPTGMTAAYAADGVDLAWNPAPEADFQFYRIYRAADPDFVPTPGSLLHETATELWTDPLADPWDLHYKITVIDHAGNEGPAGSPSSVSGLPDASAMVPTALHDAAPNPFNPVTKLAFTLREPGWVRLRVFDAAGRAVATLVDGHRGAGPHDAIWDGRDGAGRTVASGLYFYRMEAGTYGETKRMVMIK